LSENEELQAGALPELPKIYTRIDSLNALVRPLAGTLSILHLLVVPTVALLTGCFNEEFIKFWGLTSPAAMGFAMYFFKSREAAKAAGNGGAS